MPYNVDATIEKYNKIKCSKIRAFKNNTKKRDKTKYIRATLKPFNRHYI